MPVLEGFHPCVEGPRKVLRKNVTLDLALVGILLGPAWGSIWFVVFMFTRLLPRFDFHHQVVHRIGGVLTGDP